MESRCNLFDHFSREELLPLYHHALTFVGTIPDDFQNPSDEHLLEAINKLDEPHWDKRWYRDNFDEPHTRVCLAWESEIVEHILNHQHFALRHFGLEICFSWVRLKAPN